MKFACTQENFSAGLAAVSHVAGRQGNLPILSNVLVRLDSKLVKLITTNLELAVTAIVRGKVEEEGEFTVPAKLFADYISALASERIDVALVGDALEIKGGSSKTKIKGIAASEFPLVPDVRREGALVYRLYAPDFRKALSRVLFAASPNETRPEISGVLFKFESDGPRGQLVLAATDSYRLAEAVVGLHEGLVVGGERSVIVPARTLGEVVRILGAATRATEDTPATVEVVLAENQILFVYGGVEIISRLIEGNYPDYRAVIPESTKTTATIARDVLVGAVRTAALFSRSGLYDVHLAFTPGGTATITSADAQTGENVTELSADVQGTENKVVLNHRYLAEGLGAIDSPGITIKLIDGANPCLMLPAEQPPGQSYRYVVMPIKQ